LSDSGVSKADLFETFNMGIGFCVVVEKFQAQSVLRFLAACGEMAWEVGYIAERASDAPRVDIRWANE
jgi:phosphoribosylformylglycinamidine cyclo-ligase